MAMGIPALKRVKELYESDELPNKISLKYTLKTDNGSYKVEATDLPLPISRVEKC